MGKSIAEEKAEQLWKVCLLSNYKAKFNENAYFEISVDAGDVNNRGNSKVSLEGIRIRFIRKELKIVNGKECLVPVEYEFNTLKDRAFLSENEDGEKSLDYSKSGTELLELILEEIENEGYSFSKENAEIVELTHLFIEMLCCGVEKNLEEDEIVETIKLFNVYDVKRELDALLQGLASIYNCYINEDNIALDREERAKGIRISDSFKKQVRVLCVKFWLNLELKIIEKHSVKDNVGEKKIKVFDDALIKIERFIKLREDYDEFSKREVSSRDKKGHKKDLELIKDSFLEIKNEYEDLLKYKELVLKGEGQTHEYQKKLKKFELNTTNCLVSLSNIESKYSFDSALGKLKMNNKHDIQMGKYSSYKLTMDEQKYFEHGRLKTDIANYIREFNRFSSQYSGLATVVSQNKIRAEEEKRNPYLEVLFERREFYQICLKNSINMVIENLENQNYKSAPDLMILKQFVESEMQTVSLFNSIIQQLYIRGGVFVGGTPEIKKGYEKLFQNVKILSGIQKEIQEEFNKRSAKNSNEKAQELISCSNQGLKSTLYDKFMAEKYASVLGSSTENAKADVLTKALKKYLSGRNLISNLMNPIDAFYDIDEMYRAYLDEINFDKTDEIRKRIIQALLDAVEVMDSIVSVGDNNQVKAFVKSASLSEMDKPTDFPTVLEKEGISKEQISLVLDVISKYGENVNESYKKDMIQELVRKGFVKEEATYLIGKFYKMQKKTEAEEETGYYSDNYTETENSRFSAMNRR